MWCSRSDSFFFGERVLLSPGTHKCKLLLYVPLPVVEHSCIAALYPQQPKSAPLGTDHLPSKDTTMLNFPVPSSPPFKLSSGLPNPPWALRQTRSAVILTTSHSLEKPLTDFTGIEIMCSLSIPEWWEESGPESGTQWKKKGNFEILSVAKCLTWDCWPGEIWWAP